MAGLAYLLGWIWWWLFPVRKQLAIGNFKRCFPNKDGKILRRTVGEMGIQYLEIIFGKKAQLRHPQQIDGGICIGGHGGGWDIALLTVARNFPVTIFLKQPSSRFARWFIEFYRKKYDIEPLYGRATMKKAYDALKRGRLVIFVQDQRLNDGIETTFFSPTCKTSPAFATMAWRTKAPLYGIWQWKSKGKHHQLIIFLDKN